MLRVWRPSGEVAASIPMSDLSTVGHLKRELQRLLGIPRFLQRLLHKDVILRDEKDLRFTLHFRDRDGFIDVQLVVLLYFPNASQTDACTFVELARWDCCWSLESMLKRGHDPNQPADIEGERLTALQAASRRGRSEVVRMLLEAGALLGDRNPSWAASEFERLRLAVLREAVRGDPTRFHPSAHVEVLRLLLQGAPGTRTKPWSKHRVLGVKRRWLCSWRPGIASSNSPGPSAKPGGCIFKPLRAGCVLAAEWCGWCGWCGHD